MTYARIAADVKLGKEVVIHAFVNLYGCRIGDRSRIGSFVEIQKGAVVGRDCKISSHSFICEGVTIGDHVFVGHNVTFVNDPYPRATTDNGSLMGEDDWAVVPTRVADGAAIGSGATILCGLTIGRGALVGAGAVVTASIPPGEVWVGNPARFARTIDGRPDDPPTPGPMAGVGPSDPKGPTQ